MIPVSLKIKGLYSFQEEQTIDFANLIDAQVFGIFGTVGSGKSTILEAISFALFGKTERLTKNDQRNYNMMNLKSNDLLIDFEFNNYNDEIYRFVVRGKRHNTDFSKVNSFQRDAYHKQGDQWIPIGNITAEAIVGLSYENFRRTIIIPQGQFQEFLELGDKDRTNMLKELFHLGKYDFFYQTVSLEKKNNEQIQYLNGQLAQYENTTLEIIERKQGEVQLLADELSGLKKELEVAKVKEATQNELKKIFGELKSKQGVLEALTLKEPEILAKENKLSKYESCVQLFKSQLTAQKELSNTLSEKKELGTKTQTALTELNENLALNEHRFASIESMFKQLDNKKQEISDYKQLLSAGKLVAEISLLEKRISAGEEKLKTEDLARKALQFKVVESKKDLQEKKAGLPNLAELAEIKTWFAQKNGTLKNLAALANEKTGFETDLKNKQQSVFLHIPELLKADFLFKKEGDIEVYIEKLERQKVLNATKSDTITEFNNHLLLQEKLEEFTLQLQDDKPCPLCGSLHHPEIMSVENVQEERKANDEKLENVRRQNKLIEHAIQQLNENASEQKMLASQLQNVSQRIQKEEEILKLHLSNFNWKTFDKEDEKAFDEIFEQSKNASSQIAALEKELEIQEKKLAAAETNFNDFSKLLQEIQNQFTIRCTEHGTILDQIKTVGLKDVQLDENELAGKISGLEKHVSEVAENYEILSKRIIDQNQNQLVLKERIESTATQITEYTRQLEKLEQELISSLVNSAFSDLDEVTELLKQEIDTQVLREEIKEFRQNFFKSQADVAELKKETEGKNFSEEEFETLVRQISVLGNTVQTKHDFHVTEMAVLQTLKTDFEKKEILLRNMENFRRRAENIQLMKGLFKGSGFVNYISTVYLQNLCEAANARFYKLTRQQLRLEIGESNDFLVRDYLNDGKLRSAKTLSGGQMFQAALSLALALAESIQQQNKAKQNFFFLDEGFGSQDKTSLQVVFDSLKSLREENRVIGVISHVEELQQEIDMYLKLENDPDVGSRIARSWEKK